MYLWFENNKGVRRQICDCQTWQDVSRSIDEFIDQCNEHKPVDKQFKSYYRRFWKDEETGMTKIDVGSWCEFFYWEGEYPSD